MFMVLQIAYSLHVCMCDEEVSCLTSVILQLKGREPLQAIFISFVRHFLFANVFARTLGVYLC